MTIKPVQALALVGIGVLLYVLVDPDLKATILLVVGLAAGYVIGDIKPAAPMFRPKRRRSRRKLQ